MNILRIVEMIVLFLIMLFVVTQVIIPILAARPVLPFFRTRRKLVAELAQAKEQSDEAELQSQIKQTEKERNTK